MEERAAIAEDQVSGADQALRKQIMNQGHEWHVAHRLKGDLHSR